MIFPTKLLLAAFFSALNGVTAFVPNTCSFRKSFGSSSSATRLFAEDKTVPLPPWKGGHKESNPKFPYPEPQPDLSSEPMVKNLDNISKITRMQKINWPEFSYLSKIGDESSRVYVCFAQDVSRIGYDETGKIWSLICPQRGISLSTLGTAFIEVTVTGVRGWVDEENRSCYADISVEGNLWVQPQLGNPLVQAFAEVFEKVAPGQPFPFSKANAVKVSAHQVGKPYEEIWPMKNGTDPNIFQPVAHRHYDDGAYSAYHLEVEMGNRINKGYPLVDRFDQLLLKLFNMNSGNILADGQRVSWNVWPTEPEGVDTEEWEGHADKWFDSMHNEHQYPDGKSIKIREVVRLDGSPYEPDFELKEGIALVQEFLGDINAKEWLDKEKKEIVNRHPVLSFIGRHLYRKRRDHVLKK